MIKRGAADVMIAGGSEAAVCKLGIAGFCAESLSTVNEKPLSYGTKIEMVCNG